MIRKATERPKFENCAHLINTHKVDIIREDNEVVLNSSTRPVLPFEMHQIVVPLFNLTKIVMKYTQRIALRSKIVKVVCISISLPGSCPSSYQGIPMSRKLSFFQHGTQPGLWRLALPHDRFQITLHQQPSLSFSGHSCYLQNSVLFVTSLSYIWTKRFK